MEKKISQRKQLSRIGEFWGKGEEAAAIGNVIPESDLFSHCSIHLSSERRVFAQCLEMENTLISPKLSCV